MKTLYYKFRVWLYFDSPWVVFKGHLWKRKVHKIMKLLNTMSKYKLEDFDQIHKYWFKTFNFILKNWGFNKKARHELFYWWDMDNWKAMHLDKSEYKKCSKEKLFDHFLGDTNYCSDRMSYDRLFRCHWLFRKIFDKELRKYIFNTL